MNNEKTYLFSYQHDEARWLLEVNAGSKEDAIAKVRKMAYASYDGELVTKIPAHLGFLSRLIVWLRNAFSQSFARSDTT